VTEPWQWGTFSDRPGPTLTQADVAANNAAVAEELVRRMEQDEAMRVHPPVSPVQAFLARRRKP